MNKQTTARAVDLLIHNPHRPSTWPGQRRNTVAKTTAKSKGKGSQSLAKRNQFQSKSSTALAKFKPKKKNPAKSGGSIFRFRNPLSHLTKLGGVSVVDIGIAGVTMLVCQGVSVLLPGDPGSWTRILGQAGVAAVAVYFAPNSIKTPVAIGAGAIPFMAAFNKVTNNAIGNAIASATQRLLPAPAPAAGGTGVGHFARAGAGW